MIAVPTLDEKRRFLIFFFQASGLQDVSMLAQKIASSSEAEVTKGVIGILPSFYEMGWTDEMVDAELNKLSLPGFAAFKKLNKSAVKQILKKKKLLRASDVLLLKDAVENDMVEDADLIKAEALLGFWEY